MNYPSRKPGNNHLFTSLIALLLFSLIADASGAQYSLAPMDTSSPRATIENVLASIDEVVRHYFEYRNAPSRATYDALSQTVAKGSRLLDLSQVPPAARYEVASETRRLLREVIARVELPDLSEIPDAAAVKESDKESDKEGEPLKRW